MEQDRLRDVDFADKEVAKLKKKEKNMKRKHREAVVRGEDGHGTGAQLIPIEDGESEGEPEQEAEQRPQQIEHRRPKKWFEDTSSDEERSARKRHFSQPEPDSLEDLEAVASSLLG